MCMLLRKMFVVSFVLSITNLGNVKKRRHVHVHVQYNTLSFVVQGVPAITCM